jgi:hypothetical protein
MSFTEDSFRDSGFAQALVRVEITLRLHRVRTGSSGSVVARRLADSADVIGERAAEILRWAHKI